ncbi:unnamed protein product [Gordionus sp. m RMFG-2023]
MVGYHIATISSPTKRIITNKRHHNNYSVYRHKRGVYKGNKFSILSYNFSKRRSRINKWEMEDSSSYIILLSLCLVNLLMISLLVIRNSVECLANEPFKHIRKVLSVHEMRKYSDLYPIQNNKKFEQIYYNLRFFTTPSFSPIKINNHVKVSRIKRSKPTIKYISSIDAKYKQKRDNELGNDGFRFDHYNGGNQKITENLGGIDTEIEDFTKYIVKNFRNSKAFKIYLSYGWNFYLARFHMPLTFVSASFNFLATFLYALNRFIYTVYESEYHYWCSSKKTFLALSICGLLSGILYLPAYINYKLVVIKVSPIFLLHDYNLGQNNYHLDDDLFPMIIYYSIIWRNTISTKRQLIGLIYEITRELIGKFIFITIMGYLIISISREMKDKRWVIDKKHWNSLTKLPIRLILKNQEQGASDLGNRINKGLSKDLDRKVSKIIMKNELVIENNYDTTQMEILFITNMSSRHYYNWNRKFSITLLKVFFMQALILIVPATFTQLTYKLWIQKVNISQLNFIFTGYQITNLAIFILPFPLTLAIMMCS